MVKIITFGHEPPDLRKKLEKQSFFKIISDWFFSLDKFTRRMLFSMLLIVLATPAVIASYMIINSHALSTGTVGATYTRTPSTTQNSNLLQTQLSQVALSADYKADSEIINMVTLINQYRTQKGLRTLTTTQRLTDTAKWMSGDTAKNNYIDHQDKVPMSLRSSYSCARGSVCCSLTPSLSGYYPSCEVNVGFECQTSCSGRYPDPRLYYFGYNYYSTYIGENLAGGYGGYSQETFSAWKLSPGHNAVLLGSNYDAIGVYRAYNANSKYGWYWAAEFGTIRDIYGTTLDTPVSYYISTTSSPTPSSTPTPTSSSTPAPTLSTCTVGTNKCISTCQYQSCVSGLWGPTQNCPAFSGCYNNSCQVSAASTCASNAALSASTFCQNTASGIKFSWKAATWATNYNLYYTSGAYTSPTYTLYTNTYSVPPLTCLTGPGGCSFSYGVNIVWYVRACNSAGTCSPHLSSSVITQSCSLSPTPSSTPTPSSSSTPAPSGACTNGYKDADGDGYGVGTYGCYTGTVSSNGNDCCDSDSRAHPGQTASFTSPNNCGSYDYNCDGSSTIVGTYYAPSGLTSAVRLNCVGGTCGACTNGNYTPPFSNSYTTSCGQSGGTNCSYGYFNPGQTTCPASGIASYRAGCTSTTTACN